MKCYSSYFCYLAIIVILGLLSIFVSAKTSSSAPKGSDSLKAQAWKLWEEGEIDKSSELAAKLIKSESEASEGWHILFLKAFIAGEYEEALRLYKKVDPAYSKYAELDETVVHAFLHLGRYAEAEKFAISRKMEKNILTRLKILKEHPLKVTLDKLTIIPFAKGQLHEFFPDFEVELNEKKIVAHVDTGGTFLHLAPARAKAFGIELVPLGKVSHGSRRVDFYFGIAKSFRIGQAVFENVPVGALASLVGQENFIIFGTNILQPFLSTLDYPNKRLILSPQNNPQLRHKHLAMLPKEQVKVPFYMGRDHYMFARGAIGENRNLNFFIDSGLVSLHPGGEGGIRQAAFTAPPNLFVQWGFKEEEVEKRVFESPFPLYLGPLEQKGHLLLAGKEKRDFLGKFEGVRIHGLLSHAFLKKYSWTIDFSKRTYIFSIQPKE